MIQHEHKNNGQTFLFVEVPHLSANFRTNMGYLIFDSERGVTDREMSNPGTLLRALSNYPEAKKGGVKIPDGNWAVVGQGCYLTEEQAAEIVDATWQYKESANGVFEKQHVSWFKDYDPEAAPYDPCFTATESLSSLLRSLSLPIERTIVLKKIND